MPLPAGWIQDEKGRWRRETVHHMGRRLPGWDYRRVGYYVVTIVLEDRRSMALGELVVKDPAADRWLAVAAAKSLKIPPDAIEAKVVFSDLGRALFDHFRKMGEFTPGLKPVFCALMPDHLHLLLEVERELARPIGNAVAGFKTGCEKIYARMGGQGRLFAKGFVDEVVLRAGQIHSEFNYLIDNPRRLAVKKLHPDLFKYSREIRVDLCLAPQGQVGREGVLFEEGQVGCEGVALALPVPRAPTVRTVGSFSAIGNHFLLGRPLAQVQVSRRFFRYRREVKVGAAPRIARDAGGEPIVELSTPEYERRRAALFAAARGGAVLISPCISDGERQIAREALAAGYRLVTMHNKGFSKFQKPSGRYFDACAEGRLLMLAPVAWPYQPNEKPMTRADATAMNRLCQWLAGDGAAMINYHGMTPADIDRLALAAVTRAAAA
ncbi:MAG: hypothetical protein J6P13_06555 [Kiritimatiellae bacterium]|nr:hypothetical protein [Kiritimatiellia bacterium]